MKLVTQKLVSRWVVISITASISMGNLVKADAQAQEDDKRSQPDSQTAAISRIVGGHAQGIFNELNAAMANAAVNPMDEWRRDRLRKAYSAVPAAVNGVASSFFANKIGQSSLPLVQQMMGAMIDQQAPNSYDKFLKDPNHQLNSASLSADAPIGERSQGLGYAVADKPEQSKEIQMMSSPVKASGALKVSEPRRLEIRDFDTVKLEQIPSVFLGRTVASSEKIQVEEKTEKVSKVSFTPSLAEKNSSEISGLQQDIQIAENTLRTVAQLKQEEQTQEEVAFEKKAKRRSSNRPKSFKLRKPTSWLLQPLFFLGNAFETEALADPGQVPPSQGNQQGEQGAGGGSILSGLAQMIAAAAPMVVAGIESSKEQNIAKIETEAQITQSKLQADTQMALAQQSSQASMAQAQMSKDVAQMNNDEQTKRLMINLAAAQQVRDEERSLQAERDKIQQELESQKIILAQKQADDAIRLTQEKLEAQRLAATLAGQTLPSASTQSVYSGNPMAAAMGASPNQQNNSNRGFTGSQSSAQVDKPSSRLLASVDSTLSTLEENPTVRRFMGKKSKRPVAGPSGLKTAQGLYKYVPALAAGSFQAKSAQSVSETAQPVAADTQVSSSFAEYQSRRGQRAERTFMSH